MLGCPVVSSRCSLLTGQFAQWRGHGKSYFVGVRRFMFEAWQFLLAHRARLPDTVDFVLHELFSIFAHICAQRSAVEYRRLISYTRSSKYCRPLPQSPLVFFPLFRSLYFSLALHYLNAWDRLRHGFLSVL